MADWVAYYRLRNLGPIVEDQHVVRLGGGREGEEAIFTEFEAEHVCRLTCRYRDKTIEAGASDFFEALRTIRRQLEQEGLIPLCYGASLIVWPSGMARDMGRGLSAYRLVNGGPAGRDSLVRIFESGPDLVPASVEAQERSWRAWLESFRDGA